jgi:hypothetical protein
VSQAIRETPIWPRGAVPVAKMDSAPINKNEHIVTMGLYIKGTKKRIFDRKFGIADNEKNVTNTYKFPPPS